MAQHLNSLKITAASMSFVSVMLGILTICILLIISALVYKKTWKIIIRWPVNLVIDVFYRRITADKRRPGMF